MVALPMTLSAPQPPQTTPFSAFCTAIHCFITGNLETSNLVHWFTIASPTLSIKNLPWKGRGQGHVNNFYIVDLKNFATASRRYTGDIHNSSVVGLFMTPIRQWKRLDRVMIECTFLLHSDPL